MSRIENEIALSLPDGLERDFWVMTSFVYEDRKRTYDVTGLFPFPDDIVEEEIVDLSLLFDL